MARYASGNIEKLEFLNVKSCPFNGNEAEKWVKGQDLLSIIPNIEYLSGGKQMKLVHLAKFEKLQRSGCLYNKWAEAGWVQCLRARKVAFQ